MKKRGRIRSVATLPAPLAKSHPVIHAAPQFRPIRRGRRRRGLERVYEFGNGRGTLRIRLFYELDIADQDLLLGILALALKEGHEIGSDQIERLLELDGDARGLPGIRLNVSAYELLLAIGRSPKGKHNHEWLKASLSRLSGVSFLRDSPTRVWSTNLLSWAAKKDSDGRLTGISITLNPISAMVILGHADGYILEDRRERHALESDEAKGLHSVLCGLVRQGDSRRIRLDVLVDRVYARYGEAVSEGTQRKRRHDLKVAADELDALPGWRCRVEGRGEDAVLVVSRPKRTPDPLLG